MPCHSTRSHVLRRLQKNRPHAPRNTLIEPCLVIPEEAVFFDVHVSHAHDRRHALIPIARLLDLRDFSGVIGTQVPIGQRRGWRGRWPTISDDPATQRVSVNLKGGESIDQDKKVGVAWPTMSDRKIKQRSEGTVNLVRGDESIEQNKRLAWTIRCGNKASRRKKTVPTNQAWRKFAFTTHRPPTRKQQKNCCVPPFRNSCR